MGDKRQAIETALQRRAPMPDAQRKAINDHFFAQDDLYTQCPRCGEHLKGAYDEIMSHVEKECT